MIGDGEDKLIKSIANLTGLEQFNYIVKLMSLLLFLTAIN
jgi:hypothetical protein